MMKTMKNKKYTNYNLINSSGVNVGFESSSLVNMQEFLSDCVA